MVKQLGSFFYELQVPVPIAELLLLSVASERLPKSTTYSIQTQRILILVIIPGCGVAETKPNVAGTRFISPTPRTILFRQYGEKDHH